MAVDGDRKWEPRRDRGALLRVHRRDDGTILADGYAAREGVLVYRTPGGTVRELVREETLAQSAGGLGRVPVTLRHPPAGERVTAQNYARYNVGDTGSDVAVEQGGYVRVNLALRREDAIRAFDDGVSELSAGYDAVIDPTPGVHPIHGPYDREQIARRYNHVALVPKGRAGGGVELRTDGDDDVPWAAWEPRRDADPGQAGSAPQGGPMIKPRLASLLALVGVTDVPETEDRALDLVAGAWKSRRDAADASVATLTTERDAEKRRADTAEAKLRVLETETAQRADAEERAALERAAPAYDVDPKAHADLKALRRAVASGLVGEIRADAADDYVRTVAGAAIAAADKRQGGAGDTGSTSSRAGWDHARRDAGEPRRDADDKPAPTGGPAAASRRRQQEAFEANRAAGARR